MKHPWLVLFVVMNISCFAGYWMASHDIQRDLDISVLKAASDAGDYRLADMPSYPPVKEWESLIESQSLFAICDPNVAAKEIAKDDNLKALIRIWAADGTICDALGHKWRYYASVKVEPGWLYDQQCMVCYEKCSRYLADWE